MRNVFSLFLLIFYFSTSCHAAGKKDLIFSVHPFVSALELHKNFSPLLNYLEKQINRKIHFTVAKTYEDNIEKLGNDLADIVYIGPAAYAVMSEKYGKKRIFACLTVNSRPTFKGYIFTTADHPAMRLADLAGKSFAASSKQSTMGYVVPRYMFIQAGVPFPDDLLQLRGNHNNIALAVLAKDVNAGAVKEKTFHKYKNRGLKAIAVTPEISEHPFVAGNNLDGEIFTKIKRIMLAIETPKDVQTLLQPIKKSVSGLSDVSDSSYDNLRTILKAVQADEAKKVSN